MIERDKILQTMLALQPDIIAVEWDGSLDLNGGFTIVCPSDEKMGFEEFQAGTLTRHIMIGVEMYLQRNFASPFRTEAKKVT